MKRTLAVLLPTLLAAGCDPSGGGVTQWRGATSHLEIRGSLKHDAAAAAPEPVDLSLEGAAAEDTATLWCEREYLVPQSGGTPDYANGRMRELRVLAQFTLNGEARYLRMELKQHDYQSDAPGTAVAVIPRVDTAPVGAGEMWLEWEWHDPANAATKLYVTDAQSGTFRLGELTGTRDSTGLLIPEQTGAIGGFFSAAWSELEPISLSFTARCTTNEIVLN